MGQCFLSAPGVRAVIREKSPRVTVFVKEPAVFDGIWLDPVDNTMDRWFPDPGFRIDVASALPKTRAWDSRLAQIVPFPSDLTEHLATSPYVEVFDRRTIHLGGLEAKQIEFAVEQGDPSARQNDMCGEYLLRDEPCLPISADPNDEGYVSWSLSPGESYRLIDLSSPSGRVILYVELGEPSQRSIAEKLLRTLRVGG